MITFVELLLIMEFDKNVAKLEIKTNMSCVFLQSVIQMLLHEKKCSLRAYMSSLHPLLSSPVLAQPNNKRYRASTL